MLCTKMNTDHFMDLKIETDAFFIVFIWVILPDT